MRRLLCSMLAVLLLPLLFSCNKQQGAPPEKTARVSATKDYEKLFGRAPTTEKGICYAFVIYFPSSKLPGKVVPFPFFTFDQASLKKVAVVRLIGGMADVASYRGEIQQPFPPGTHLLGITEEGGTVTVNFSRELLRSREEAAGRSLVNALVLTLAQFEGVRGVRILVDGEESALDKAPRPTNKEIQQPSPPRLLSVTAIKERGARNVEEVDVFFDRPVDIKTLQMAGADGKPFQGDIYQSVFDMAAVLKPKEPSLFKQGMPVKVRWQVTDKMGRNAAGEGEIPLEVKEH